MTPSPSRDQRIAHLFLTGYSLDLIAEQGATRGWTRVDARNVADANGWTLDSSGRIPRDKRTDPPTPAAPTVARPALPGWAAALIEGLNHPVPRIRKRAQTIHGQLEQLAAAIADAGEERQVRERIAQLEAERAELRAKLKKKPIPAPRPAKPAPAPGEPTPIEHGTWGGYLLEKRRGLDHCDACLTAKDAAQAARLAARGAA